MIHFDKDSLLKKLNVPSASDSAFVERITELINQLTDQKHIEIDGVSQTEIAGIVTELT